MTKEELRKQRKLLAAECKETICFDGTLFESKWKPGDKVVVTWHPCDTLIDTVVTLSDQYQYSNEDEEFTGAYHKTDHFWLTEEHSECEYTFHDENLKEIS